MKISHGALVVIALTIAFPLLATAEGPTLNIPASATPIAFVPFTLADLINEATHAPYAANDHVRIAKGEAVLWEGPAQTLLNQLNTAEKYYNAVGITLRNRVATNLVELIQSDKIFNEQFLASLNLLASQLKGKARTPLSACFDLDLSTLGTNPESNAPFQPNQLLPMQFGMRLTANQLLARVNEQRKLLCQVGYDILDGVTLRGAGTLEAILRRRDTLLSQLGISKIHSLFDLTALAGEEDYAAIVAAAAEAAGLDSEGSVKAVYDLADKAGAELPPGWKIPDIPNIPSAELPKRQDLKLLKRLVWKGFDEGDRSIVSVYAHAWFEVRGDQSTKTLDARGQAKAGSFVLGNEINFIDGRGFFTGTGNDGRANGEVHISVLGMDVFSKTIDKTLKFEDENKRLWHKGQSLEYSQTFMAGPVPVTLRLGLHGSVYVGYKVALVPVSVYGQIRPGASIEAFAEAAVGVCGFLCAGAGGAITIIDAGVPLRGRADLNFDGQGLPYLGLNISAAFEYELLSGRVYVFADFPVPFAIIHAEHEIFRWRGEHGTMHIFNWGIKINPFGVALSGDSVDANDRENAAALEQALTLQQRAEELAKYEQTVQQKERDVFTKMIAGLNSDATQSVSTDLVRRLDGQFSDQRRAYFRKLADTIASNSPQ